MEASHDGVVAVKNRSVVMNSQGVPVVMSRNCEMVLADDKGRERARFRVPYGARLLADEPGVVLARLSFAKLDGLLRVASDFAAPFFARWLGPDEASRAAEWAVRIVISYLLSPSQGFDLADAGQTRRLVATFVLPGVVALGALGDPAP